MKTLITLLILSIGGLSLTSCSTTSQGVFQNDTQTSDYATAGAMVATIAILDSSKTPEDKDKKKAIIEKVLSFLKLSEDGKITAQELEAVITAEVEIKAHWKIYITTLMSHVKAHVNVPQSELVKAIAAGVQAGLDYE